MNENVNQITFRNKQASYKHIDNDRFLKGSIEIAKEGLLALTNNIQKAKNKIMLKISSHFLIC